MTLISLSQDWIKAYTSKELYTFIKHVTENQIIDVIKIMHIDNKMKEEPIFQLGHSFKGFILTKSQRLINSFVNKSETNRMKTIYSKYSFEYLKFLSEIYLIDGVILPQKRWL